MRWKKRTRIDRIKETEKAANDLHCYLVLSSKTQKRNSLKISKARQGTKQSSYLCTSLRETFTQHNNKNTREENT